MLPLFASFQTPYLARITELVRNFHTPEDQKQYGNLISRGAFQLASTEYVDTLKESKLNGINEFVKILNSGLTKTS